MKRHRPDDTFRCSFCHKSQEVVGKLISSPNDYPPARICDECITVCNSIMEDDKPATAASDPQHADRPFEIGDLLDQYLTEVVTQRVGVRYLAGFRRAAIGGRLCW